MAPAHRGPIAGQPILRGYNDPMYRETTHDITVTVKPYYLAEIPITQEMYDAVMGQNPSLVKDPQLPVQNGLRRHQEETRR